MPDPTSTLSAARPPRRMRCSGYRGQLERGAADIAQLPLFEHLSAIMPVADLLFGGGMMVLIVLVHAAGVRAVTDACRPALGRDLCRSLRSGAPTC